MMRIQFGARLMGLMAVGLLWGSFPAWAQAPAQLGNELAFAVGGNVSAGYSGSTTNSGPSSYGLLFGGSGNITGSYHSPQFLSFDISPFYNESRNDSSFQSISDSSGVTLNTTIFGGSKFPAYVNYTKVFNSEGNYFVPGLANYRTNGDTQNIGVGWSYTPSEKLSFRTGYQQGDNTFSVYGVNGQNYSHYRSFFATASYNLDGFRLNGGVNTSDANNTLPLAETGQANETAKADSTTYTFNLSRSLPLSGTSWLNYSRNDANYTEVGSTDSESTDVVTGGIALKPARKLSTSLSADYDDNLAGTVYQAETAAGVLAPVSLPSEKSHSWGVYGQAQYNITDQFYVSGIVAHRQQLFLGTMFDTTAYSGDVNYGRQLWGGQFTAGTILTENTLGGNNGTMLGVLSTVIYSRRIGAWSVSGSGGYSRNTQSLLIAYTTSGYNYSASATRRVWKLSWNGAAGASKSTVAQEADTNSTTQNYSTGLSTRRIGVSGGYSKSSGLGLYTAQGITSLPTGVPPTLLPSTVLYGGTSYSAGIGGMPIRGLTFSGNFVDSRSNTLNSSVTSNNHTQEANLYVQYKVRKIFFTAGYSRLLQGFTVTSTTPALVNTYYFGLSRWFNFF